MMKHLPGRQRESTVPSAEAGPTDSVIAMTSKVSRRRTVTHSVEKTAGAPPSLLLARHLLWELFENFLAMLGSSAIDC